VQHRPITNAEASGGIGSVQDRSHLAQRKMSDPP
jgi:hypothetical protein